MNDKDRFLYEISQYYKKQRTAQGLTQKEVAEIIDVEIRTLQKFENEQTSLSLAPFIMLTKLLNIPDSFLHDQFQQHLYKGYQKRMEMMNFKDARKK